MRELVLQLRSGLCNRLFSIATAIHMAEATSRSLLVRWDVTKECYADFYDLFLPSDRFKIYPSGRDVIDFDFCGMGWSVADRQFPPNLWPALMGPKDRVTVACDVIGAGACEYERHQFSPVGWILKRVPLMGDRSIGVHARFGEFKSGFVSVDRLVGATINHDRGGTIFLATDDGFPDLNGMPTRKHGVIEAFDREFGDRLHVGLCTPGRDPVAVRDAVVDLWTLRSCRVVVGNYKSTFSRFAAFGRDWVLLEP